MSFTIAFLPVAIAGNIKHTHITYPMCGVQQTEVCNIVQHANHAIWKGNTSGNHRVKLCIMTAAMRVLPRPVGRQTSVFCSNAVLMMFT